MTTQSDSNLPDRKPEQNQRVMVTILTANPYNATMQHLSVLSVSANLPREC